MKTESTMDFAVGEGFRDAAEAWIGKIIAIAGGLWAIWKGTKFATHRIRQVWRTLNAFADSVEALRLLTLRMQRIEAEQHIRFELAETPRWIADAKGNRTSANAACLRLLGLSLSEVVGTGWAAAIHPDDYERVMEAWHESVEGRSAFRQKFRIRTATETVMVESKAFPMEHGDELTFLGATAVLGRKPITVE